MKLGLFYSTTWRKISYNVTCYLAVYVKTSALNEEVNSQKQNANEELELDVTQWLKRGTLQ